MTSRRIVAVTRWAVASATLTGIVTVYQRWAHVNSTTVALTLLLFILVLAARWGLRYAVVTSVAATVFYNYFFLPPVRTFIIADPQNWLALLAFLTTAVIASRLSARIQKEAEEARRQQHEVEILFHLSRELLANDQVADTSRAIPGAVANVTGATDVLLYLARGEHIYRTGPETAAEPVAAALDDLTRLPAATRLDAGWTAVPIKAGMRPRGVLLVAEVAFSHATLEAIGGLVSVAIDRARALEELTRNEAARESDRLRGVMLDSITHELRTPLTSIKAAVSTMLDAAPGQEVSVEDRRELLAVIDEESDRLNRLVTQAVEMAQLDTREIRMQIESVPVAALLDGIAEETGGEATQRQLTFHVAPGLPAVQADRTWVRKVLSNLIDNAVKYSDTGSPVCVTAELAGASVALSVADRGAGVDPLEQAAIFDKFFRSQTHVQRIPGTGMGLAIARAIVEAHGGTLTLTSQVGRGSVFTFTLPAAE